MIEEKNKSENHEILLARIDERTRILNESFTALTADIKNNYVSLEHFRSFQKEMKPIKQGFYAFVSVVVFTVVMAIIGTVIKK